MSFVYRFDVVVVTFLYPYWLCVWRSASLLSLSLGLCYIDFRIPFYRRYKRRTPKHMIRHTTKIASSSMSNISIENSFFEKPTSQRHFRIVFTLDKNIRIPAGQGQGLRCSNIYKYMYILLNIEIVYVMNASGTSSRCIGVCLIDSQEQTVPSIFGILPYSRHA